MLIYIFSEAFGADELITSMAEEAVFVAGVCLTFIYLEVWVILLRDLKVVYLFWLENYVFWLRMN